MTSISSAALSEKRFPRATFTRKLVRICAALDAQDEAEVTSTVVGMELTSRARVARLWVAGSYARGAKVCGDLDLVMELQRVEGGLPLARVLARKLVGSLPYVSYYGGVPEKNSSGVEFPEAIELWSGRGSAWRDRLGSIAENPEAGPAPRPTDILPVRPAQLGCGFERLERVMECISQGILASEFIPFDLHAEQEPIDEASIGDRLFAKNSRELGKKSHQILPALTALLRAREPGCSWTARGQGRNREFWYGGSLVEFGPSRLPIDSLLDGVECAQIVIAPHFTARGPNGAWLLRRGPCHPDAKLISELQAVYLTHEGFLSPYIDTDTKAVVVEFFTSKSKAREFAGDRLKIAVAKGEEVLNLCAIADAVDLDGDAWLAVRKGGTGYAGSQIATVACLVESLKSRHRERRS